MKKETVINYFGGVKETSKAMKMHENSVRRWKDDLPLAIQCRVEFLSRGALLSDDSIEKGIKPKFDWERYANTAKYIDVIDRVGHVFGLPRIPTIISPDGTKVLLKTSDIVYQTDDYDGLNRALKYILHEVKIKSKEIKHSFRDLYLLELDFYTVWDILARAEQINGAFECPERILYSAIHGD